MNKHIGITVSECCLFLFCFVLNTINRFLKQTVIQQYFPSSCCFQFSKYLFFKVAISSPVPLLEQSFTFYCRIFIISNKHIHRSRFSFPSFFISPFSSLLYSSYRTNYGKSAECSKKSFSLFSHPSNLLAFSS